MNYAPIDIICPVRNGGRLFGKTLDSLSAIASTDGIKLIISDNHSTDNRSWLSKFKELQAMGWDAEILSPPSQLGRTEHWSWAFSQGTNEWIKPLFVGDKLMSDYFRVFKDILNMESVGLASGQHIIQLPDKTAVPAESGSISIFNQKQFLNENLIRGNILGPPSAALFRRKTMIDALPFDEDLPWAADWALYLRAAKNGDVAHIRRNVVTFNQNSARFSTSPKVIWTSLNEEWRVRTLIARDLSSPVKGFAYNLRHTSHNLIMKYGRAFIPKVIRKPLGSVYQALKHTRP